MTLYKVQLVQELKGIDHPMRFRFSEWACGRPAEDAKFWAKTTSHGHRSEDVDDVHDDPDLLKKVITGDESWVYGYDIETKAQSS